MLNLVKLAPINQVKSATSKPNLLKLALSNSFMTVIANATKRCSLRWIGMYLTSAVEQLQQWWPLFLQTSALSARPQRSTICPKSATTRLDQDGAAPAFIQAATTPALSRLAASPLPDLSTSAAAVFFLPPRRQPREDNKNCPISADRPRNPLSGSAFPPHQQPSDQPSATMHAVSDATVAAAARYRYTAPRAVVAGEERPPLLPTTPCAVARHCSRRLCLTLGPVPMS
ncbi:hypothetical protein OPV22_018940 [Ensete ventricosum]|uniref:Uncharacterized protein n=1 Tax=Ensete ventricosum TaxID=4639 RepID=A0AAV8QX17_ENSVE|nr:hypothetical protein OPV22_018940 [Ensete ventricosum]